MWLNALIRLFTGSLCSKYKNYFFFTCFIFKELPIKENICPSEHLRFAIYATYIYSLKLRIDNNK